VVCGAIFRGKGSTQSAGSRTMIRITVWVDGREVKPHQLLDAVRRSAISKVREGGHEHVRARTANLECGIHGTPRPASDGRSFDWMLL
jgi:hypothetical protein